MDSSPIDAAPEHVRKLVEDLKRSWSSLQFLGMIPTNYSLPFLDLDAFKRPIEAKERAPPAIAGEIGGRHDPPQAEDLDGNFLVTLDQAAASVHLSKRSLEKYKKRMPRPHVQGRGGRATRWLWRDLRPWLEETFGVTLNKNLPALSLPGGERRPA